MILLLNILGSVVVTIVLSSFLEWFVHGPMMHGKLGTSYLNKTHREHHEHYGAENGYKNADHGPHVHLPWWSMVLSVGLMAVISSWISRETGRWEIAFAVTATSALYYIAYQYVHTCIHVPKGRWFEGTSLCKFLDRHHHVHHARDEDFGRLINICVLFPLADWVMQTTLRPKTKKD